MATAEFSKFTGILSAALSQYHLLGFEIVQLEFPDLSVDKESICNAGDPESTHESRASPWRRDRLHTPVFLGFHCGSAGKESSCNAGDLGLIPGLGRLPGEAKGYPHQYSGLENSMDSIVHGVTKN